MRKWVVFLSAFLLVVGVTLLHAQEMHKKIQEVAEGVKKEAMEKVKGSDTPSTPPSSTINVPVEKVYKVKMGKVTFPHAKHILDLQNACVTCHHEKKIEENGKKVPVPMSLAKVQELQKMGKNPFQCRTCHGDLNTKAFKKLFHSNCFACHKKSKAAGKKAPTKCRECHVKPKKKVVEGC